MIKLYHLKFGKPSLIPTPDVVDYEDYYNVALLDINDLEEAWTYSQNGIREGNDHWDGCDKVKIIFPMEKHFYNYDEQNRHHRSSAVGDLLSKDGKWFITDMVGFKPVEVRYKLDEDEAERQRTISVVSNFLS